MFRYSSIRLVPISAKKCFWDISKIFVVEFGSRSSAIISLLNVILNLAFLLSGFVPYISPPLETGEQMKILGPTEAEDKLTGGRLFYFHSPFSNFSKLYSTAILISETFMFPRRNQLKDPWSNSKRLFCSVYLELSEHWNSLFGHTV